MFLCVHLQEIQRFHHLELTIYREHKGVTAFETQGQNSDLTYDLSDDAASNLTRLWISWKGQRLFKQPLPENNIIAQILH